MFYFGIKTIPVREHLPPSKAGKTYQWCLYQVAALQQVLSLLTLHLPEVITPASALVGSQALLFLTSLADQCVL